MMRRLREVGRALKMVYAQKQYYLYSLTFAFLVFSLNPLLRNYRLLKAEFSLPLALRLIIASPMTSETLSVLMLFCLSVLSGMVLSLSLFVIKRQISQSANVGLIGTLIGIAAPACPSCALGLLGAFSVGGLLTFLPFKGKELGVLGIILLLSSLFYLSRKIETTVCSLPIKKGEER